MLSSTVETKEKTRPGDHQSVSSPKAEEVTAKMSELKQQVADLKTQLVRTKESSEEYEAGLRQRLAVEQAKFREKAVSDAALSARLTLGSRKKLSETQAKLDSTLRLMRNAFRDRRDLRATLEVKSKLLDAAQNRVDTLIKSNSSLVMQAHLASNEARDAKKGEKEALVKIALLERQLAAAHSHAKFPSPPAPPLSSRSSTPADLSEERYLGRGDRYSMKADLKTSAHANSHRRFTSGDAVSSKASSATAGLFSRRSADSSTLMLVLPKPPAGTKTGSQGPSRKA